MPRATVLITNRADRSKPAGSLEGLCCNTGGHVIFVNPALPQVEVSRGNLSLSLPAPLSVSTVYKCQGRGLGWGKGKELPQYKVKAINQINKYKVGVKKSIIRQRGHGFKQEGGRE